MATKELKTRIALKYDTYENWTKEQPEGSVVGKNLVLLAGEIGICEVPSLNGDSNVAPTVLFKVGNGSKKFHELPWASAKAADVYGWAKSETVVLTEKEEGPEGQKVKKQYLEFKTGNNVNHSIDLSSFATDAEVEAVRSALDSRIAAIEDSLGGEGDTGKAIKAIEDRLDVIEGDAETEGSIDKAVADAEARAAADATSKANAAEAAAKSHADAEFVIDRARMTEIEGVNTTQGAAISANESAIAQEVSDREAAVSALDTAYKAADAAINAKIGGSFNETDTVAKAISDAQTAAQNYAKEQVDALAEDAVATNAANIAQLTTDLGAETDARVAADEALDERLADVEAFFHTAEGETLDTALDTLKEIQDYLNGEGEATGGILSRVAENESDIKALQETLADGGAFETRVDAAEAATSAVADRVTALETLTGDNGAIQTAIAAAQAQADKGVADAKTAQDAADKAQGEVDDLEGVVATLRGEYDVTKELATTNASDIADLTTRVTTAEGEIDALQATVDTATTGLKDRMTTAEGEIDSLQALTGDASKGNEALRSELTTLQGIVNHAETGLAKTKEIADDAAATASANSDRLDIIEGDYLKQADEFIFNCGTSTTITHTN